ncbi:hypothetical protein CH54_3347 [Yersinia rochesterensis]|uniref:Uncharacterized protein n=1 Tax=Yersinia rochesterensis TaxID=1604335 RepID=A0ABM5SNT4_9GAMM|nr:hypothetical protein DJ57_116 [Yersinia rochesterensis]AJI87864.1 hypothetical protein AW19_2439 [Yersinia frederiksenii Y225]AJJ36158.1 hypothetical protein CH54_3347 [Yersinia rochesterensis]CRY65455.1 Uncharacterised protein [Yersinia kristensenii]
MNAAVSPSVSFLNIDTLSLHGFRAMSLRPKIWLKLGVSHEKPVIHGFMAMDSLHSDKANFRQSELRL